MSEKSLTLYPLPPPSLGETLVGALRKIGALFFLLAVALVPISIVLLEPGRGGIWIAGYVTGIVTVPLIAVGALRSILELSGSRDLDVFVGFVVFGTLVVAISAGAALWAFLV